MPNAGPLIPGFASNVNTIGTVAWSNLGNLYAEDVTFVTVTLNAQASQYLAASSFGFSIPVGATINGIVVEWKRKAYAGGGGLKDNAVRIIKGGTVGTTDASSATAWSLTNDWNSYGGSFDLWGLTFSPSDINANNFGCALSTIATGPDMANVDCCRITVFYNNTPSTLVPCFVTSVSRIHPMQME